MTPASPRDHTRRGACATTHKRIFITRDEARHNLRISNLDLSVYKCEGCGYFHQGGWHGTKDRAAHRGETTVETMSIADAAHTLNVSHDFIKKLIATGKVQSWAGSPYASDIDRLTNL